MATLTAVDSPGRSIDLTVAFELPDEDVELTASKRPTVERVAVLVDSECVDAEAVPQLVSRHSPRACLVARE